MTLNMLKPNALTRSAHLVQQLLLINREMQRSSIVKRGLGWLLAIAFLIGIVSFTQVSSNRILAASPQNGPAVRIGVSNTSAPHVQIDGFPIPEPVSIVLSSFLLLGATTLLRRSRVNRRS